MKFVIEGELPSQNEIIKALNSRNRQVYNRLKQRETDRVAWTVKGLKRVSKAYIRVHWYCKNRKKDPDNIMAGIKFILDGLVVGGVLENDGWKQIKGISHEIYLDRDNPRIEVEIKEAE